MGKNGGARPGAGRKPKATEQQLIERLSPMDDIALEKLKLGIKSGDFNYIKLFMEYRYGKPKQQLEHSTTLEGIKFVITGETDSDT